MDIATVIASVFRNFTAVLLFVAVVATFVKVRRGLNAQETPVSILWREMLFYTVGVAFLYVGLFHAFFQGEAASSIGWTPSPFEWELAWAEFGMGLVAIISLWGDYRLRLAATLMFGVFCVGVSIQHVNQMLCCHNYAPGNAGTILWFNDITLPLVLLVLAVLARPARSNLM